MSPSLSAYGGRHRCLVLVECPISACLPAPAQVGYLQEKNVGLDLSGHLAWHVAGAQCVLDGRKPRRLHSSWRVAQRNVCVSCFILDSGPSPHCWAAVGTAQQGAGAGKRAQAPGLTLSLAAEPQSFWFGWPWRSTHLSCWGAPGKMHGPPGRGSHPGLSMLGPGQLGPWPLRADARAWERLLGTTMTFTPDLPLQSSSCR